MSSLNPVKTENLYQNCSRSAIDLTPNMAMLPVSPLVNWGIRSEIISKIHGRSVAYDPLSPILQLDEYGHPLGSLDWKGARLDNIFLTEDKYSRGGVRLNGLLVIDQYPRIVNNSEIARRIGIPTERILSVEKILELPLDGRMVDVDTWKTITRQRLVKRVEEDNNFLSHLPAKNIAEKVSSIDEFFATDFIIIQRENPVNQRYEDLCLFADKEELIEKLSPTFRWLNLVKRYKPDSIIVKHLPFEPLRVSDNSHIYKYLTRYLPETMGRILGLQHMHDIRVNFASSKNFTSVGTPLDVDSWTSPIFGDDPNSEHDLQEDLQLIRMHVRDVTGEFIRNGYFNNIDNHEHRAIVEATQALFFGYLTGRLRNKPNNHSGYDVIIGLLKESEEQSLLKKVIYSESDHYFDNQ